MPRNRVIYQSEALFVGPLTPEVNPKQLHRIQSANYDFNITRQDVNQYGELAAIDRIILEQPTVNLEFSYYLTSGNNETELGFHLSSSEGVLKNILDGTEDTKNYFIGISSAGKDQNQNQNQTEAGSGRSVIGIGNGFMTSYSVEAAVGSLPTATVSVEGLNMKFYTSASEIVAPNVEPETGLENTTNKITLPLAVSDTDNDIKALRPGDVSVTINGTKGVKDLKVQNASISLELNREDIQKLGSKFAFTKEVDYPVTVTAEFEAVVSDTEAGSLAEIVKEDSAKYTISVEFKTKSGASNLKYELKGAKLDSQSFSSSIGENKTVSLAFSAQVGGPSDSENGLFITKS
jgi:hypothetical protein